MPRPGCSTSSTAASTTSWSMRHRTPARSSGESSRRLADEFFAGPARARGPIRARLFAVGDEKQSIFSFQGADRPHSASTAKFSEALAEGADLPFADLPAGHLAPQRASILSICRCDVRQRRGARRPHRVGRSDPSRSTPQGSRPGRDLAADAGAAREERDPWTEPSMRRRASAAQHSGRPHRRRASPAGSTTGAYAAWKRRADHGRRHHDPGAAAQCLRRRDDPPTAGSGRAGRGRRPHGADGADRDRRSAWRWAVSRCCRKTTSISRRC